MLGRLLRAPREGAGPGPGCANASSQRTGANEPPPARPRAFSPPAPPRGRSGRRAARAGAFETLTVRRPRAPRPVTEGRFHTHTHTHAPGVPRTSDPAGFAVVPGLRRRCPLRARPRQAKGREQGLPADRKLAQARSGRTLFTCGLCAVLRLCGPQPCPFVSFGAARTGCS